MSRPGGTRSSRALHSVVSTGVVLQMAERLHGGGRVAEQLTNIIIRSKSTAIANAVLAHDSKRRQSDQMCSIMPRTENMDQSCFEDILASQDKIVVGQLS